MKRTISRGVTLIEVLVAIAIAAILVGLATPPFRDAMARARLEGAVSGFATDLQYTRTEAIRGGNKGADLTKAAATLQIDDAGAGYTITVTKVVGEAPEEIKKVDLPSGVTFTPKLKIEFDGLRGTANAATIEAKSDATAAELKISTNALGRVSLCSPSGTVAGYLAC